MAAAFVLGKYLYIDGGEQTVTGDSTDGTVSQIILKNTLAIDLSTSFSTATKNSSIGILEISKGQCPNLNSILFWNDENRQNVYAYGGWFSSFNNAAFDATALPSEKLWAFVANNSYGTWQDFNQSSNPVFNSLTRPTFGSATSGAIGGFGLGGYEFSQSSSKTQNLTSLVPSPGLQFYNSTARSWYNNSGEGYTPEGTSVYAGAIYLPTWGTAGLVAIFGGQTTSNRTNFIDGDNYLSMSNISLFDPSSQSWYFQESTGDVPSQRDRFCVVGASGGDKTTFEIFLYSGQAGAGVYDGSPTSMANNSQRDEVYVLSLPAFVWFKANYTSVDPRIYHTCHVVGNQILSIGGLNPSLADLAVAMNDTDPFWEGIKVFDMTALEWTNYYNASSASYTPSGIILDYYGGELKYPPWSLSAVENLFIHRSSSKSSPSPIPIQKGMKSHTDDTIGGTVGGVGALLASITCVIFLFVRKKGKKHRKREEATGRLPVEYERDQSQVAGGLYEADNSFQAAEAGPGEPRTTELDTGQPIPQEVDAVALSNLFELENPSRNVGPDCSPTPLELGRHNTNGNVSRSIRDPPELGRSSRHLDSRSRDAPIELEALLK
ncbi:MAG: hypothetical protein ALECFALPRED_007866 [Alectoria fallacina]|uniref:Kelch repeat protein n=1 Tax=Alectoria fallacina TaxID=1903189 RepID=A0A8H3ETP9_9LECA|nr:MAG: hypothetical protein ALECFALPRED_007866 [Alectoria fallacina]